jgi:G:T-mismatch repair DNA endonuclease (very short patch repair protein)
MVKDSHFSELGWRGVVVWNPEMHSTLLSSANSFSVSFYRLLCSAM